VLHLQTGKLNVDKEFICCQINNIKSTTSSSKIKIKIPGMNKGEATRHFHCICDDLLKDKIVSWWVELSIFEQPKGETNFSKGGIYEEQLTPKPHNHNESHTMHHRFPAIVMHLIQLIASH